MLRRLRPESPGTPRILLLALAATLLPAFARAGTPARSAIAPSTGSGEWGLAVGASATTASVEAGGYHNCGITSAGTITCWGSNDSGQATPPAGTFTAVTAGEAHSCAIADDQSMTCWGANWNGQHGVLITDTAGELGEFRHLLFVLERTRSPLQKDAGLTGTLFFEIDVHSSATLAQAGDAEGVKPGKAEHVWVVFKTHLDIGYTDTIEAVLEKYRVPKIAT